MSALGSLVVKLALEYAEYTQGLDRSSQESLRFAQNAQKSFDTAAASGKEFFVGLAQGAVAAVAAYVSVGAVIDGLKNSIDSLANLDDMAQKTGASVENLSRLQKVAAMTGTEFGNVDSAIGKLAKGMATVDSETSKVHKALKALGVSTKDAAGNMRDPSQVMIDVATNLQGYKDGAGKAALANDLLGKSGADLLPYLNDVAENVDKFAGVSTDAAQRASELQDKMGLMRVKVSELYDSLASDLLPTFIDFIDALNDTNKESGNLYKDGAITSWADDSALGAARLIDVLKTIPGIVRAVSGSFESVYADLKLLSSVPSIPKIAYEAATGGNAIADFKNALAERNKVVEEANNRYVDLWSKPANTMEQAVLARIDARTGVNLDARDLRLKAAAASAKNASNETKKALNYTTGNPAKNTATAEKISDYEKLTRSINEKIAADELQLTVGHALSDSEKILSKLLADRASGAIHLTDAEQSALEVLIKKHGVNLEVIESSKRAAEGAADMAKIFKDHQNTVTKSIDDAIKEAEKNEELARTFGMTKGAIEQLELARLEDRLAQRASVGMTLEEIEALEKLIGAKQRNAAAVGKIDELDAAEKFNKELLADQKKTVEKYDDIFRNGFADMLNNGMNGWKSFNKSLVTTFKTTVADQIYKMFAQPFVVKFVASMLGIVGGGASGAAQAAGGGSGALGMASNAYSMYNNAAFAGNALFGSGSGTVASWMAGTSAVAPTSVAAANVAGAVGGDALGTLIAAEGWSTGAAAAGTAATGTAATGTAAAGGFSTVLAAIPVWGWAALAVMAVAAVFGGRGDKEVTSQGIEGNFGNNGFNGSNFANWEQDGGWFHSDSSGKNTSTLDSATAKQFSDSYASIKSTATGMAATLGLSADSIASYSEKISVTLTGKAEEDAKTIAKMFSDMGDHITTKLAPGIASYAKEGEAASATMQRLSGSITTANAWLSMLKQRLFQVSLAGGDAASKLADAFGGLENLTAASKSFYELYYTEGERAARSQEDMAKALAAVNLAMPATKDELRNMADSLDLNTESGRAAYKTLLAIAPEFASVADITAKLAKETADKLIAAFTGGGKLVPALDASKLKTDALTSSMTASQLKTVALATGLSEAQIKAGVLTTGISGMGTAAGNISTIFLDAKSGLISFNTAGAAIKPIFTGAQLAGILLNAEIDDLRLGADKTRINFSDLSLALLGIDALPVEASVSDVNQYLRDIKALPVGTSIEDVNKYLAGVKALPVGTTVADVNKYLAGVTALPVGTSIAAANAYLSGVKVLPVGTSIADANAYLSGIKALPVGTSVADVNSYLTGVKSIPVGTSIADVNKYLAGVAALPVGTTIADVNKYLAGVKALPVGTSIEAVNTALNGVNTETFVVTMGLVFDNLAARIQGVIDSIGTERIAVREAALQIINPTVMSKAAIERGIAGINTGLPSNAGVAVAGRRLTAADAALEQKHTAESQMFAALGRAKDAAGSLAASDAAKLAARQASLLDLYNSRADIRRLTGNDSGKLLNGSIAPGTYVPEKFNVDGGGLTAKLSERLTALQAAKDLAASHTAAAATKLAPAQAAYNKAHAAVAAAQNVSDTAAANAKKASLAYASALQSFAVDASKSVGKLSKLREETVKYYEAQKQLADLMGNSAAGLRGTVADYRYNQLSDSQQLSKLQADYASTYAMGLSTSGETLAGYGDKLSGMLNPLLEKAKSVMSDSAYSAFEKTTLARAEAIAGRLETLTPTNYAADSLTMLGSIDTTLAALDASSKSAEKLITDAIKAGSDKTADGLRALGLALTGKAIPAFASGGSHAGGLRIVGERGWELESTGPSQIFNQQQLGQALRGGGSNAELVAEIRGLRQDNANMRIELRAIASSNASLERMAYRNNTEGTLVRTEDDTPLATVAA